MKLTRRDLIEAGCAVAATSLVPHEVDAWTRVVAPSSASNTQRTVINIPNEGQHYLNIAKSFAWNTDPTIINADGYPTTTPTTSWGCGMGLTPGYYGSWTWSWTGTASMQCSGPPLIVLAGGTYFGLAGSTGDIQGNATITSQNNPTVVFQFGWNIQSITSGGPGGTAIKIVAKTGWVSQFAVGTTIPLQITGANVNTGANGNWTAVVIDTTSFYLQGSTFTNAQGSAGGIAVFAGSATLYILNSGTLSSFANLIFCRTPDYTAVQAGSYWDGMGGVTGTTTLVGQLQDLMHTGSGLGTPGWLRFMDLSTVQGNFEKDWAQRTPVTALSWPTSDGRWVHDYWISGNNFSQTGDAYSCSDPTVSVWSGTDYIDGAIVQGHIVTPNTGGTPTLAVGGHPALPIIGAEPIPLFITCNSGVGIATIAATGSSYNIGTGLVTLNLSAGLAGANAVAVGDRIVLSGITGTGTDLATLDNGGATPFFTTITGTTGTTVKFTIATGLTITTITGGNLADLTAAAGQSLSFTWSASRASWLNSGSNYTMSFKTRSSCTDGPTLGFHLEQCVMASNDNNARVPGILLGSTLTVCALATVNGGSYISGTGATTLTFIGPMDGGQYPSVGDSIVTLSLAGTGAVNSLNGPTYTLTSVSYSNSGGSTLVTVGFTAATGLGSLTITSGQLFDITAAQPCPFISVGRGLHQNVVGAPLISSGGPLIWNVSVGSQTGGVGFYQVDPEPVLGFSGTSQSLGVQVINQSWFYTPCAQAGRFSATSVPSNFSSSTLPVGYLGVSSGNPTGNMTFVYNYLMKAWMALPGPLGVSLPVEAAVQLCNTVGANYWNNILEPSSAYMTSYAGYVAANLNSGLKLGIEYGNENWNFTNPRTFILSWGAALGWSVTDSGKANLSFTGLRTKQYSDVIRSAWVSAGRTAHDFYMLSMHQAGSGGIGSPPDIYQNKGIYLNATNFPLFGSYGGFGGGAPSTNYDTFPNRPIDACDATGCAAYWGTAWWAGAYFYVNGPVGANAPALQASLDYANGSISTAFSECVNMFNGTTVPSGLTVNANVLGSGSYSVIFPSEEAAAAQFDGQRQSGYNKLAIMHYEGGPQWSTGINLANGVNSVNPTDIGALAGQIVGLGWDVSPYTQTGKPTVASGTYNNSTGVVALTLNSSVLNGSAAQFTASCYFQNGYFVLDISAISTGTIKPGMTLHAPSGVATCTIVSFIDNGNGAIGGRWEMSVNQTVASQTMFAGDTVTVSGLTGIGAIASLIGTFVTSVTTSGTTVSYQATACIGSITINNSAGNVYDSTAGAYEVATNVQTLGQAWKNDVSYKNMIKTSYFQEFANISGINREIHPGQYGYAVDGWGLFPTTYSLNTPYQNYYAIKEWNA